MKKELCAQLAVLLFLVVACGSGAITPTSKEASTATGTPEIKVAPTDTLVMQIAPTSTPVPPPPTPTPKPTSTPTPPPTFTPTPLPTSTPLPTKPEEEGTKQPTPTFTPTPPPTPTPTLEPVGPVDKEMVLISGGEFMMGSSDGDADEAPPHLVSVASFWMDLTEVTNDEFAAFTQATGYQAPSVQLGEGNHPVSRVTWDDANAYCTWASKRLPTEAEWEFAARGTDGRVYPWGNDWDPTRVNGRERGIRGTTAVGSFGAGASPFGVLDMAGNVREWTAHWYDKYPGSSFYSQYFNKFRVHRGGGWFDEAADLRAANRNGGPPDSANDDLGFRCVRDAGS
ncbi:MAG: formylglycine-generating enzyme family protein [Anaerolineae bacterium]|nr:MAG: formylglycine-generating enzyme family protein [Anaerolineae bacterium]